MKKSTAKTASKIIALLLASVFACSFFAACKKEVKVDDIYDELIKTGNFTELSKKPENQLMDEYGIDPEKLSQWVMAFPLNPFEDACMIEIFEAKDEEYAAEVAKKLESILKQTQATAKGYSDPEKAKIIEKSEVVTKGKFVYCIAGNNYDDLMAIMKKYIG